MDSNAHSLLNCNDSNVRGEELEDFIIKNYLMVENLGSEPTFRVRRGEAQIESIIDITISRGLGSPIKG